MTLIEHKLPDDPQRNRTNRRITINPTPNAQWLEISYTEEDILTHRNYLRYLTLHDADLTVLYQLLKSCIEP